MGVLGRINLVGGTINADVLVGNGSGIFNFASGTLHLSGSQRISGNSLLGQALGDAAVLGPGRTLIIDGNANLNTSFTANGGTLSVGSLSGPTTGTAPPPGYLLLNSGTINITNQPISVQSGGVLGDTLDVAANMTINVTQGLTNYSLVSGDGRIGGPFVNAAGAEIRAESGRSLTFTGAPVSNSGKINLFGGALEFVQGLTNNSGGTISGNGTLTTGSGLYNVGQMRLSGETEITGAVDNASGAAIITASGATTFYDNVYSDGEIRTSSGATTVFFGNLSGNGTLTGPGIKTFESGASTVTVLESSGSTDVESGAQLSTIHVRESSLIVNGLVLIGQGGTSLSTSDVSTLAVNGKLNLTNNKLIVAGGSVGRWTGSAYDGISGLIKSGRNGGAWNGNGIVTSMPPAIGATSLTTIGAATAAQLGISSFGGLSVSPGDVLIAYTYAGDANLDGRINGDDYFAIDSGYAAHLRLRQRRFQL